MEDIDFKIPTDEFILQPGYSISGVAAEPLLQVPVAMTFDAQGRIWAVELPGYMRDIDGADEHAPDGKIVILTDEDNDGVMDNRTVFLDSLIAPRTLLHAYGGLLYSKETSLWWAELENDKIISEVLVDSLYVVGGNIEHQPNGLFYNIDNWIYSSRSKARYRLKDGEWLREPTSFRGQWGLSGDENGRLYYNNNSLPLATDNFMPNQVIQNKYQKVNYSLSNRIATDARLYLYQATAVNRGYLEDVLDEEGKVQKFTSACSPLVVTGNLFAHENNQNVLVCAPEGNLLKRYTLRKEKGLKIAEPVYENSEFLISKDETFRPVNLYNAPDGSVYILDLRKGVIQHRAYMTSYLREKILEKGLDTIVGKGRIYRITSDENLEFIPHDFSNLKEVELLKMLTSSFPYERNFAQQQLVFRQSKNTIQELEKITLDATNPYGQLHAIWTLEGLNALSEKLISQLMDTSNDPLIQEQVIRFSANASLDTDKVLNYYSNVLKQNDSNLNRQIALHLGKIELPRAEKMLFDLAENNRNEPVLAEAVISGIEGKEVDFLKRLKSLKQPDSLSNFLTQVIANRITKKTMTPELPKKTTKDKRTAGFELYSVYCAACHGMDGYGKDKLAPPLVNSEYISGSKERLGMLLMNGVQGPITVDGKRYDLGLAMPGLKDNSALTDKDILSLMIFIRNSFSFSNEKIIEEDVGTWREMSKGKKEFFTEEELMKL
ncbi:MAG: mono/diheme cytochrome c family protein [Saprospiraceae bacterium]|jgi:mono/diheme cytochrome c family protein